MEDNNQNADGGANVEGADPNSFWGVVGALLPVAIGVGEKIINYLATKDDNKQNENQPDPQLESQINELKSQKQYYEELNKKSEERIGKLEKMLQDNIDEMKKRDIEREKELLEKQKKEEERQIEELKKKEEALKKCRRSLTKEFSKGMFKIISKFSEEEKKWVESINQPEIQNKITNLKQKLEILFDELFQYEKILEKINNKFIDTIQKSVNQKELEKMNFILIGTSGVGKSTLINEIFGEQLAKEGMGTRTTLVSKKYESKLVPFLSLVDTMGTEIGSGHRLVDVLKETLQQITEKLNSNDPNEHVHCILYCTTSNRFFKDELEVILKLREKYDGKKLPIVIVYTRAVKEQDAESIKNAINDFLKEHGESLSDDIFGITFIKVNAREEKMDIFGEVKYVPCFGLPTLMTTCFNKGEKSYRIAIKNSLIQIGKNKIKEYLDDICDQLANNLNYFFYLSQAFEPNFPNYIAYCFEKICDVDRQIGITNEEKESLQNYINNKKQEQRDKKEDLTGNLCMFCSQNTNGPYVCSFCNALSCEQCYLSQFQQKDVPRCILCDQELIENKNMNMNNKSQVNNSIVKSINYMNILNNDLNLESRNSINNYIEDFRSELIDVVSQKFDGFTKEEAKKLYTKILEKYLENMSNNTNNANLKETMKSKGELKAEVTQKLNSVLKDKAIEDFLKKNAAEIYQQVIQIFKKKLNEKIDDFINNIDKNEEVNNFFDSCEVLDEKKELKLRVKINSYIKELQNKEAQSQERALQATYGPSQSQMMSSIQIQSGESGESSSGQCGESSPGQYGGCSSGQSGETGESKTNQFC